MSGRKEAFVTLFAVVPVEDMHPDIDSAERAAAAMASTADGMVAICAAVQIVEAVTTIYAAHEKEDEARDAMLRAREATS